MTAKQVLMDYVAGLSEEEAMDKIPLLIPPEPDFPPASPEVMAKFHKSIAELDAGFSRSHEEVFRRFNLD
jgi:hypothetical protein